MTTLALAPIRCHSGVMQPHTRAAVAAAAHALVAGGKVAGLYDHAAGRHLRVAAEAREGRLQGYDGDRGARFGGTLPEVRDEGDGASIRLEVEGRTARGYDRGSGAHLRVEIADEATQVYDYAEATWFAYAVQVA